MPRSGVRSSDTTSLSRFFARLVGSTLAFSRRPLITYRKLDARRGAVLRVGRVIDVALGVASFLSRRSRVVGALQRPLHCCETRLQAMVQRADGCQSVGI